MFGIDSGELLIIAVVALVVIGPKDLPRVMRTVGQWVGRARGMAKHFRSGIDTMIREAELEDMEKNWQARQRADHARASHARADGKPVEADWARRRPARAGAGRSAGRAGPSGALEGAGARAPGPKAPPRKRAAADPGRPRRAARRTIAQ